MKHNRASIPRGGSPGSQSISLTFAGGSQACSVTSTIINYIDRQTLSVLAPFLKQEYKWSNTDFATILIAFRLAYTIGQAVSGRVLDWLGTRRGLTISVAFYSIVASLTSLAHGIVSFRVFRFLLGAGESANWPGATKAVSEWFPAKERGWAVAIFDSGSSIGGVIAPFLVLFLYRHFGSWRPAFVITGCLGFLWLLAWTRLYRSPEKHPRISPEELELIQLGRGSATIAENAPAVSWRRLLHYRQTWGIMLGRAILDPYWFMISEWFALYLVSKGFQIEQSVLGFWAPFLGSDLGNLFGGALSSWWIARGWPVGKARRTVILIFGPSMLVLIAALFTSNYVLVGPDFRLRHLRLCRLRHDVPLDARGCVPHQRGGLCQRSQRDYRRNRYAHHHLPDRRRHRQVLVRAGDPCGVGDALRGDCDTGPHGALG